MKLDNRIWTIITVIVSAAIVAGGWFLGVQPQLAAMVTAQEQTADADAQNQALQAEIAALQTAQASLPELRAEATELQLAVPDEMDSSAFITSLNALADSTGTVVTSIEVSAAQAYAVPVDASASSSSDGAAADGAASDSATSAPAPAPTATTDEDGRIGGAPLPTTNGLITPANFVVIPVSVTVTGGYGNSLDFVDGLRTGERLILVHGVTITRLEDGDGNSFETVISALVYALPGSALPALESGDADADAAGGSGADATPAPTDSATPAPGDSATPEPSDTPTANPLRKPVITGSH